MDKREWGSGRLGLVVAQLGLWSAGPKPGGVLFYYFFLFCFSVLFPFFYLFSFSILIQLRAFKYLINLCFLYYNYLCDIRHNQNIFVSMFEN